jgi:hypothetical protein
VRTAGEGEDLLEPSRSHPGHAIIILYLPNLLASLLEKGELLQIEKSAEAAWELKAQRSTGISPFSTY